VVREKEGVDMNTYKDSEKEGVDMKTYKDKWTCRRRRFHTLQGAQEFAMGLKSQSRVIIYYNPVKRCTVKAGYVENGEWICPWKISMELFPYVMHFCDK
jgi:hypothetical protein